MKNFGILIAHLSHDLSFSILSENAKDKLGDHFQWVTTDFWKNGRKMTAKIMSILLTFFIFVIVDQAWAHDVKSMENTTNQHTLMKMNESRVSLLKRTGSVEEPVTSQKKLKPGFQSAIAYSVATHGPITGSRTKLRFNFLRALEQKRKLHLSESLHKVIYSFEFFQDPRRDRSLHFRATDDTHSPDSTFNRTAPNRYLDPYGEKYFEDGKIQSTLKLLQSKREEIFNEIFVGFRFSFGAKNTHTPPEMRISPSFEKGAGFIIAF